MCTKKASPSSPLFRAPPFKAKRLGLSLRPDTSRIQMEAPSMNSDTFKKIIFLFLLEITLSLDLMIYVLSCVKFVCVRAYDDSNRFIDLVGGGGRGETR